MLYPQVIHRQSTGKADYAHPMALRLRRRSKLQPPVAVLGTYTFPTRTVQVVLMEDDRAAMIFIDPPYNVPIEGHVSGLGAVRHREFPMASGEMDEAQFTEFLTRAFEHLARFSLAGALHFICMDPN